LQQQDAIALAKTAPAAMVATAHVWGIDLPATASLLAAIYSLLMICDWCWRKWRSWKARRDWQREHEKAGGTD
jgi:hypothetical protein